MGVDLVSPDPRDPGKFAICGQVASTVHRFNGWALKIRPEWVAGSMERPEKHRMPFDWYALAIPDYGGFKRPHYCLCEWRQVREWVREFDAPLGRDHLDHDTWRAQIHPMRDDPAERTAYFRWGDEPLGKHHLPSRVLHLDNADTIAPLRDLGLLVGIRGRGGESEAHRSLKLWVARNPSRIGVASIAEPKVEYSFLTGDRVDVMFENHVPNRTVVEIEVEGERELTVGVHQAVKYRTLAETDLGYELQSPRVRAAVAAFKVDYAAVREVAEKYEVDLVAIDRREVLATSSEPEPEVQQ